MQTLWIGLFVLLIIGLLVALLWWRFKGGGVEKQENASVVTANHPSIVKRHYGPAPAPPVVAPPMAAPPLAADNPLSKLMPEEAFRAQEEKDIQAEADRIEAEEAEQREAAEQASQEPSLRETPKEVLAVAPEEVPTAAPPLRSSLHVAGATLSVFDALGLDEPAPQTDKLPTAAAPVADELPTAADLEDDSVPESLFYNALSADAPTKNDAANRLTKAELRRRTREAIKAEAGGNKAALTTLLAENNASR